jgi:hypothetical protein
MIIIKSASVGFALLAFGTGMIAAIYWYRSSKIHIDATWTIAPGDTLDSVAGWTAGTMQAFNVSSSLNARAAIWTAISVMLTAFSSFLAILA